MSEANRKRTGWFIMDVKDSSVRVLVVDDVFFYRTFFAQGLRQVEGFIVDEADEPRRAFAKAKSFAPHAVLLNLSMNTCSGMSLMQSFHRQFPQVGVLAFSCPHSDHLYAERAISAGAAGYLAVNETGEDLICAVQTVAAGGVYLCENLRRKLCIGSGSAGKSSPFERLSSREFEVFCLAGHGYVPKRIAEKLKVSVRTIETYRERIREKLGLTDGGDLLYHATHYIREQCLPIPEQD